jgi:hypothetical protein
MPDDATPPAALANRSYDGRKSGPGLGPDPAVEVRVRAVRRRDWSPEERLRIVRETRKRRGGDTLRCGAPS